MRPGVFLFRALQNRNYRLFFGGQIVSLTGTWIQQVAMSWLAYRLTDSALFLGVVAFVGQLPGLFFTPLAGVIADRHNRRVMLIVTQSLAMAQAVILSVLVLTHRITVVQIIALSVFIGVVNAFDIPIRQAFTMDMLGKKEDLGNAIALNSSMFNAARLLGPSIAGIVIAAAGEGACFVLNAVSYPAVIVSLACMTMPARTRLIPARTVAHELREGFRYAFGSVPIRTILMLLAVVSLMGVPYQVLMPVFARDVFHGGPRALGFLVAMSGAGALLGALYLAMRRSVIGLVRIIAWSAAMFGAGIMLFSICRSFWAALLVLPFAGFGIMVETAASNTILQTIADEDKRGRVMSFYTLAFMGTVPFGSLLAGVLAQRIGAPYTLALGGICCIAGGIVFYHRLPAIREGIRPIYLRKGILPVRVLSAALLFFVCSVSRLCAEETLTWQGCVSESARNHPDLISAEEAVKQSEADRKIIASGIFPQITADADITRTQTMTTGASGNTTRSTGNSYGYGVSGGLLLFDGLKSSNNVHAAAEEIKAAQYNYRFTSAGVRFRLRSAFINLLKAQELLEITRDIREIRRANFQLITLRYESGVEHRGALLTAEANLAGAELEIRQAHRALEAARRELVREMGRPAFSPVRADGDFNLKDPVVEKPDFETLAAAHPSLAKLTAQKNAAAFDLKSAAADFFPQLSASVAARKTGARWPPVNDQWNAGLAVSWPLFEGGRRFAGIAQAQAVYHQAQAGERSARDGLIVTLAQAWAALRDAHETVEVQKKFLEAGQERARIAEAQYSLGLVSYDDWTIIEDDLVRVKKSFLDSEANAVLSEAEWVQAKGETLEYAD